MRLGFVTCVNLGFECLKEIYLLGFKVDVVFTLSDHLAKKKSGRVYLDDFCAESSVPLVKIDHINSFTSKQALTSFDLDWLFIIGWSQIADADVLAIPSFGVLGVHPTLLPVGRGRASIPWAILKQLPSTGVTLFKLDEGVDSGPIASQISIPLAPTETATELYKKTCQAHISLIREALPLLIEDRLPFSPQDSSLVTYWPGRKPSDGLITSQMTISEIDRLVRATTHPYPGAYFLDGDQKYIVWSGSTFHKKGSLPYQALDGIYWILDFETV